MNNQTGLSQKFSLIGRTAIVTGGAGLLGSEFCRTIVDAGGNVVIADIQGKAASKLAAELPPDRDRAQAIQVDVTSKSSVDELVEAVLSSNGRIDILVNSAALDPKFDPDHVSGVSNAFEDFPLDAWEEALRVNLTGAFLCSQAVAAAMLQQGSGVIINICSTYGLVGPDQRIYERAGQPVQYKPAYYTVTKAGILGFTRYLAAYFAGKNIRVNALSPGGVLAGHDDEFVKHYSARTVLGRMAQKDELNGALLFLASDASSYMTGANLVVDGGWTAW
jgi:NAD(P)-dependent dehydrogenase (short-subunit alcohol dehydrogenase family)